MSNFIDKMVGYFHPKSGLQRQYDRKLLNKYNASLPSNPHTKRPNKKSSGSANSVNRGAKAVRERVRHMDENNPLVTGILDELCSNVIGPNGIMIEPQPLDNKGEVHTEFAQAISKWLELFSLNQNIDAEHSRSETEWLACRTWLRDGEVFGRLYMGKHEELLYPTNTPFAIQPFEPDFIPHQINEPENGVSEGIKRNKLGQAISYLIQQDAHGFEFVEIDAFFMVHLKFSRRLHQNRGISLLHSIVDLIDDIDDYDQSERVSAQIASRFAYFIKREVSGDESIERDGDMFLGMGNSFELSPGEDAGIVESNRKETMSSPFRDAQLRLASSGAGVNNSSVTRDYSNGSYSSQRQELVDSFSRYRVLQRKFILNWTRPQYRHALNMALLSGEVKIPKDVDKASIFNAIYQAPVMPWIDPSKEMTGIEKGTRLSLFSLSQAQRERNISPLATRLEVQSERKQLNDMNIVSTSDPAHSLVSSNSKKEVNNGKSKQS